MAVWYPIRYHWVMDAAALLRRVRQRSGLSLRGLAVRADTSHSALSAYESGRKVPSVETVGGADRAARGRELVEVLDLAAQFPARHAATLDFPVFPRAS